MRAPVAPRDVQIRTLHGESVADPYAWMADRKDPRLLEYLRAERDAYEKATSALGGTRARLAARLRERSAPSSPSCPWWQGGQRYQLRYAEGAEHPELVRWLGPSTQGSPQVLLDVEAMAQVYDYVDLGMFQVSDDGYLLAYAVDSVGDEAYDLRWRDLRTGQDLPDVVPGVFLSGAWSADASVFFYSVLDESFRSFEIWRHVLGASVDDDARVFHEADRHFDVEVRRSRTGAYVLISSSSRTTRQELIIDANKPTKAPVPLRERRHGVEDYLEHHSRGGHDPGRWLLVTNEDAREFRLLAQPVGEVAAGAVAGGAGWTELVAERPDSRLEACDAFTDALVLSRRRDGGTVLEVITPDGAPMRELFPAHPAGEISVATNHEANVDSVVVEDVSLIHPAVFSLVRFVDGTRIQVLAEQAPGYDPQDYITERTMVPARDGTPIPVTLAYRRDLDRAAAAPGLLYGYGAYEVSLSPRYTPAMGLWLDQGLVYARAHVRGGGECGRTWWEQGSLGLKMNTFTDYLDVAHALITSGVVDADRLATRGRAAGGLLQGAVLSLEPQLWRAMVAEVPVVDCLNTMLRQDLPLTVAEWQEWGDPRQESAYRWMRSYTPYENLPAGALPALMVTSALYDAGVGVHEPAKWVAALRARLVANPTPSGAYRSVSSDVGPAPLVFRAETGDGSHGGPSGGNSAQDYEAEVMAFVLAALNVPVRA